MRATRLVLGTLAFFCAAAWSPGVRSAQAASPGEPAVAGKNAQRSRPTAPKPGPAEPLVPGTDDDTAKATAAAPSAKQQDVPPAPPPPDAVGGQPSGEARPAPGAPGAGVPAAKPPPEPAAAAAAEGRGTLVYQGPAIPRSVEEQQEQEEQQAQREREERDDEISGLQAQIDELRGRMEAEPAGSADGAPHLQQLEAQMVELQERVRLAEQARLERIAGYCDLWRRLRGVQQEVAYGEWEVRETLSWADWLLRVYYDEAQRMGAQVETVSIEEALDGLRATRAALEQENLFEARVDLALAMAALERARKAAEFATSPANQVLGR